jgi:hypothetical protein
VRLVTVKAVIARVVLATTLSGCVVTARPAVGVPGEVMGYSPRPPVRYEAIGVAPPPGYFWIGGAWFWEGGRYTWHPARREALSRLPLGA